MKKGLEALKGLFCSAHTLEHSVLVYTESPGVKETIGRTKATTRFLHRSPLAMAEMLKIQVTTSNPLVHANHLVQGMQPAGILLMMLSTGIGCTSRQCRCLT